MSPLNSSDLQRIFETIDRNGDGFVTIEELNWHFNRIGVDDNNNDIVLEDLESLIGKSKIDLNEFLCLYESITEKNNEGENRGGEEIEIESDLLNAFKVFDENGDGFISCDELENVLVRLGLWDYGGGGGDYCRRMIGAFDRDLDGRIDFEEFKNMMSSSISSSS